MAHQVDREHRVLKALNAVPGFPVPKAYGLCMDIDIIGTAFYVSIELFIGPSSTMRAKDQVLIHRLAGHGIRQRANNEGLCRA